MNNGRSSRIRIFWRKRKDSRLGRILQPLSRLYSRVTGFINLHRVEKWIISGKAGGEMLKIFFAGRKNSRAYISGLAFGNEGEEKFLGKSWFWMVPFHAKLMRKKYHAAVLEMKKGFKRCPGHGFLVPLWVGGDVDLLDRKRLRTKNRQNDMRKIRKYGLSYEVLKGQAVIEEFYRTMYRPYVKAAHGKAASCSSLEEARSTKWNWELLLIKKEGEPIGGTLIQSSGRLAHLWGMGVRNADIQYLKMGLCGAIDHFGEEHLRKKGFERMHYGGSRAFLKDGVLNYKKDRGLRLRDFTEKSFFMSFSALSRGAKNFLQENPFLYNENNRLFGAVFTEAGKLCRELVSALHREYFIDGMAGLNVFVTGALPGTSLENFLPEDLAGEVGISRFGD